jgi:O-antigen/teichoic acid export membrane protein
MLAGTAAGQAISIVLSPILTRLFTPEQFGYLSVYNSVLMILAVVASLGFELAIPICLVEAECANLLVLCCLALAATTTLCSLLMWLLSTETLAAVGVGSLSSYRYLLPVGLAWLGGYFVMVAMATRGAAFQQIAQTRISQGVSGPVSQILLGWLGAGTAGLVAGSIIGQASGTLLLARFVLWRKGWWRHVSWHGIAAMVRRYIEFPLYAGPGRVLDMAGGGMILFVLFTACYSPAIAGFIFLSERVIMRPLIIVSTSLLQVFTGEAGRAASEDPRQLRRRFDQIVPRQILLAAAWIAAANALAGWAFPLLFGPSWAEAIPYLRALSLFYLLQAVLHPVSTTLQVLERQITAVMWQIGRFICAIAGVVLPWHLGLSALAALWISAITQAVCCLVLLRLMKLLIDQEVARRHGSAR